MNTSSCVSISSDESERYCVENIVSELTDFAENLVAEGCSGEFISTCSHIIDGPGIEIAGFGLLPLPAEVNVVTALQKVACASPLSEFAIPASRISCANPAWGKGPPAILDVISRDLEVPQRSTCFAVLSKLLVSGPGEGDLTQQVLSDASEQGEKLAGFWGLGLLLSFYSVPPYRASALAPVQIRSAHSSLSCPANGQVADFLFATALRHVRSNGSARLPGAALCSTSHFFMAVRLLWHPSRLATALHSSTGSVCVRRMVLHFRFIPLEVRPPLTSCRG